MILIKKKLLYILKKLITNYALLKIIHLTKFYAYNNSDIRDSNII